MAEKSNAIVTMTLNRAAKAEAKKAIFDAIQETFEIDMKTEAKQKSPVKTGTNRRSIDTEVKETPKGIEATLFTQSGYGGYLELGTSRMAARPYMYPAFTEHKGKIATRITAALKRLGIGKRKTG